jgi:hypothetical protein
MSRLKGKDMTYSKHAAYRMRQRNITQCLVETVLLDGDIIQDNRTGCLLHCLDNVVVVVDDQIIVTVYLDNYY